MTLRLHQRRVKKSLWRIASGISLTSLLFYTATLGVLITPQVARAAATATGATVNGAATTTVGPSASVTVAVTVTTDGTSSANDWQSTRYRIEGGSWQCVDTPSHITAGTYSESFSIDAPSGAGGYDLDVRAYNGSSCASGEGDIFTLSNAIVVEIPTYLTVTNAAVDGGLVTNVLPGAAVDLDVDITTQGTGNNNDWESTGYRIEGGAWECEDHPDHTLDGSYSESFGINAPGANGVYDVEIVAYSNDICTSAFHSETFTLSSAIVVTTTQPAFNPLLGQSCGLDLALVFDGSGSISASAYSQMQTAFNGFVSAFVPGTPTQMGIIEFATTSVLRQGFTADAATLHNEIDEPRVQPGGQFTNWEAGIVQAHTAYDPRPTKPDLIVFASDGNPNRIGNGTSASEAAAVDAAVVAANAVKADGIRVIALAIGNDINAANLEKISSADAVIASSFDTLAADLAALAEELCPGDLKVNKKADTNADGVYENVNSDLFQWNMDSDDTWRTMGSGVQLDPGLQVVNESSVVNYHFVGWDYGSPEQVDCTGDLRSLPMLINVEAEGNTEITICNAIDTGAIHGQKWSDPNGNGERDCSPAEQNVEVIFPQNCEPTLNGWTVYLDLNGNGQLDGNEPSTQTQFHDSPGNDDNGWYWFDNLVPGTYSVCEVPQGGWQQTYPLNSNHNCHTVTVPNGNEGDTCFDNRQANAVDTGQMCNFGNRQQASVTVLKNVDENGDGDVTDAGDVVGSTAWTWDLNGGNQNFATGSTQTATPGAVALNEDLKSGYHFVSVTCDVNEDPFAVAQGTSVSFDAATGNHYTCTFTNAKDVTSLGLAKEASPTTANRLTNVTYTLKWSVAGNSTATGVVLTDPVPTNMTFVSAADGGVYNATTRTISWDLGTKAPGTNGQVSWVGQVAASAPAGALVNTAAIDSNETDPAVMASVTITVVVPQVLAVVANPTLTLTKTANPTLVNSGQTVSYTLVVANTGDATAVNVRVTDTLPEGFTFTDTGLKNNAWTVGDLEPGVSKTLTYQVTVDPDTKTGTYQNEAVATADNHDSVMAKVSIEVRKPSVLGAVTALAETGAGMREYLSFVTGLMLVLIGTFGVLVNRRRPVA